MSPETSQEHQSQALSSTVRHLTQRDFPGSDEVFQKIKALIGGKSTENIPQIQKLLEEMQTAYSKRISNLLSSIQSGSIRIRDAHQEVQQMLHEIQVFKGNDMPEEVAAITEAITSMCTQISKKVHAVRELINETPVVAPAIMAPIKQETVDAIAVPTITPAPVPTIAVPEIAASKEKLLDTWEQEIIKHTQERGLVGKLLLVIAKKSVEGKSIARADLATLFGVEEKVINYTLQNWKQEKMQLSFVLSKKNPYKIYSKKQGAPTIVTAVPAEISDTSDTQKIQWLEAIRSNSRDGTGTRKALEHIVETYKTGTTWEALMSITEKGNPKLIYDCLRVWWSDKGARMPFTLEMKTKSGIRIFQKNSAISNTTEPAAMPPVKTAKSTILADKIELPLITDEQVKKWLKEAEEHSDADSGIRRILIHIITNHQREVSWEELMELTGNATEKQIYKALGNWKTRHGNKTSIRIKISKDSGVKMVSEMIPSTPAAMADITAPTPITIPAIQAAKASPAFNAAAVERSTAPMVWLNEINRISSPGTSSRKILVHMANNHEKEIPWLELLQISGEEVETQQLEKRIGRWQEKFAKNAPFKIATSTAGAKMVAKDTPEETTTAAATVMATAVVPQSAVPPEEATLSEAETSGHQGKAMIWISKLPPGRMTEKVAYEALAGKFGTEVTKEELMNLERTYNRERMIGKIDMISFVYRLNSDRVPFSEMPFTVVKTEKGFKMMQKETKKVPTAGPASEATPEQIRKEKAMKWFSDLNLDSSTIIYGFLKTLAENPSAKISDRKILEGARRINPKMTTDDLYTMFSDVKKKGRIKAATYPMSNYTLDIEMKSQRTDDADKYFFKLHEIRL